MENSSHSQNSRSNDDLFFTGLVLAVVLGLLFIEAPRSFILDPRLENYRSVLIFISLGAFIETYIMLSTYHREFRALYHRFYLFFDIAICFLFVFFVSLMRESQELERQINEGTAGQFVYIPEELALFAIYVLGFIFIVLIVRLVLAFNQIRKASDFKKEFQFYNLFIAPLTADIIGIIICGALIIGVDKVIWSLVAAVVFIIYILFRYVVTLRLS